VNRREFVKVTVAAGAGLALGMSVRADTKSGGTSELGPFIHIATDGIVTIYVPKSEMGQGVRTSLAMIVAEELDGDWSKVRVRTAPLDKKFGPQGTGGSGSVQGGYMPLRRAGATARAMLVTAAAAKWGVDPASCTVAKGVITSGAHSAGFGEVAEAAAKLEVPKDVPLKDTSKFAIIGKSPTRVDNDDIVRGKGTFGIDVKLPGMLYAAIARSPVFEGKVASFDDTKAKQVAGVKHVVRVDAVGKDMPWNGVAVVATSTWAAIKGRNALEVKWDEGAAVSESTESLRKAMSDALDRTDLIRFRNEGNVESVSGAKTIEATYEVPWLAHATLEPMNATANVTAEGAEIWAPTQFPDWVGRAVGTALKLKPDQIKVNVTLLGGGFGRRIQPDYAVEAALVSKAVGAPVHVQWTRDDDMGHDFFRPPTLNRMSGALDADGKLIAYTHRMSGPAIRAWYRGDDAKNLEDSVNGALSDHKLLIPNQRFEYAPVKSYVPRGWWRSVEQASNVFVMQSFLDELAHAAGKDPIEFQLALVGSGHVTQRGHEDDYPYDSDRMRRVIEIARDKSGWGKPLHAGRGRGFAAQVYGYTYVAQVAEVTVKDGSFKVDRVTCAIDCGTAIYPDGVASQVEGGIVFALAAMSGEITIDKGRVEQTNFHDYPIARMSDAPFVETIIVPSTAKPSGVGEPPVPSLAPAVTNAIFAATGKRVRSLPIKL
jgi:isoquinoline 1-oxidoreductase beta subunit